MSNTNQTTIVQGASGATDANFDNALSQGSAGPAALAQRTIYETMALYLQVVQMDQKQKNSCLDLQSNAALSQAKATIAAGDAQAQSLYWQGGMQIASAGASIAANSLLQRSDYNAAAADSNAASEELEPHNNINKMQTEGSETTTEFGTGDVENAALRMKGGDFGKTEAEQKNDANVMKALRAQPDDKDYLAVKKQLDTKILKLNEDRSAANSRMQSITSNRTMYSDVVKTVVQAISNVPQAHYTKEKAKEDAKAGLYQSMAGMTGSTGQSYDSQMSKMYDTALAGLQALDKLRNSGQVN